MEIEDREIKHELEEARFELLEQEEPRDRFLEDEH